MLSNVKCGTFVSDFTVRLNKYSFQRIQCFWKSFFFCNSVLLGVRQHISCEWLIFWISTVKWANSASPFKFHQVKFSQKSGLENDKMLFSQTEIQNNEDILWKTYFIILKTCLLWEFGLVKFRGLAELAHLTVYYQ